MSAFFAMGGYAGYVWSSYGLAAAILIWNIWSALAAHQVARAAAQRALARSASTGPSAS